MRKLHFIRLGKGRRLTIHQGLAGCLALFLAACTGNVPDDLLEQEDATGIIFVKATRSHTLNSFSPGGNLYSLIPASPDGKLTNLTNLTDGDVADPEISYDGMKVLFSMQKSRGDSYNIFEMNIDGTNLRQITNDRYDDHDPTYMPNGKILFTSNRTQYVDEYNKRIAEVMHVMDADGSNIERVSFNMSDDFDPFVKADGRIIFTRWDHHGTVNRFPLFFTNPDGHGSFTFFSPHSNAMFFHPREMPDGSVISIRSDEVNGDEGPIVLIKDFSTAGEPMPDGAVVNLTPHISMSEPFETGAFKYPHALPDGRIIAAFSPRFGTFVDSNDVIIDEVEPDFGLYTMDSNGKNLTLLYNDPDMNELDAVVVVPRSIPPVIPSQLNKTETTGILTVESVYFRQSGDGQEIPDQRIQEAKNVMVIEAIPRSTGDRDEIGVTEFEQKRILGVAPIQADGSFSIEVPANTPFSFNVLDSLGRSIVSKRNWVTVRPGEHFEKCSGCHGPRGENSGNPNPIAATLPPANLEVPEDQRVRVRFGAELEPIIAAKCESCHVGLNPAAGLDLSLSKSVEEPLFSNAYINIMGGMGEMRESNYVTEPFSRRSRLIDILMGFDQAMGSQPHPAGENALTPEEIKKFINWVDLGGQYR
jgi:hypothetical protein